MTTPNEWRETARCAQRIVADYPHDLTRRGVVAYLARQLIARRGITRVAARRHIEYAIRWRLTGKTPPILSEKRQSADNERYTLAAKQIVDGLGNSLDNVWLAPLIDALCNETGAHEQTARRHLKREILSRGGTVHGSGRPRKEKAT